MELLEIKQRDRSKKPRAHRGRKQVVKTRRTKSRPTEAYQKVETEVQQLLQNATFIVESGGRGSSAKDEIARGIDFFCQTSTIEANKQQLDEVGAQLSDGNVSGRSSNASANASESDNEHRDGEQEVSVASKTQSEQSFVQVPQTASTYIQIVTDQLTERGVCTKYNLSNEALLYEPQARLNVNLQVDQVQLDANTRRMLNRYNEEAKTNGLKLAPDVVEALTCPQQFIKDPGLFRTFCEHQFHPIFCEPAAEPIQIPTRKLVTILLKEIHFTEHPRLTEEHRLANKLELLFEEYRQRLVANECGRLSVELLAERKIVSKLLKDADRMDPQDANDLTMLEHHLERVRELREHLYNEETTQKQMLNDLLRMWLELKKIRKAQEYQTTRFKLCIKIEERPNIEAAREHWNRRFETDLNEVLREELERYYRAKRMWKQQQKESLSSDRRGDKPIKPDVNKLSLELKKKMANALFAPDEPHIEVFRSPANEEECYQMPTDQRVKSFLLRIYFDGQLVGATRTYRLEPDLRVVINEAMGVLLERRLPKTVGISILQKSTLGQPKKLARINIPLMLPTNNNAPLTHRLQFNSQRKPVAGELLLRFQCDEESYDQDSFRVFEQPEEGAHKATRDDGARHSSGSESDAEIRGSPPATCTIEEDRLQFCPRSDLDENPRFKLLHSRHRKDDARTKDLQLVPILEKELAFEWSHQQDKVLEPGNWMDPIDWHKHQGKKYIRSLYDAIESHCARLSKALESGDNPLIGDEPASWSFFFRALALLFHPTRPLNPLRQDIASNQSPIVALEQSQQFIINLHVVRATGIPVRHHSDSLVDQRRPERSARGSGSGSGSRSGSGSSTGRSIRKGFTSYTNVRPYVSFCYRDKSVRTLTAEGSNPTWNEQLVLQLSGSLMELKDDVRIALFDEVVDSHSNDDDSAVRAMDIYQRIHNHWLAEYRIPMSTVLTQQKFEGVIELNSPLMLLGYKRPSLDSIPATSEGDASIMIEHLPAIKETIRLWYYLDIQPIVKMPKVVIMSLESSELRDVRQHLFEWSVQVKELQPQRYIDPLVCTMDGKRVCITRLLEAVPLPTDVHGTTLDSVCRFVSLLSVLKGYNACMAHQGVWLNNQVLLDTTWGSAKDLGVLLCNYMLSMGMQSWLVLGVANPYCECTFVLYYSEDDGWLLIDPSSAKRYSIKDVFCPLSKIKLVVAQNNLYCNIQSETRLSMTNFNFGDSSCWLAAFSKRNPAPLGGIQKLDYVYKLSYDTVSLRTNIERKVMKKITSWRTMRKTIWNRALQARLYEILRDLEKQVLNRSSAEMKHMKQLAMDYPAYKIYGCTLNFSYTNLTSISERIKAIGIHLNSEKNIEFSVAVYVHSYPNNVFSTWIFLASILPSR